MDRSKWGRTFFFEPSIKEVFSFIKSNCKHIQNFEASLMLNLEILHELLIDPIMSIVNIIFEPWVFFIENTWKSFCFVDIRKGSADIEHFFVRRIVVNEREVTSVKIRVFFLKMLEFQTIFLLNRNFVIKFLNCCFKIIFIKSRHIFQNTESCSFHLFD